MPVGAISGAVGLYGASKQAGAAKDSAKASQKATDATIAEHKRQFDLTRSDQMPWLNAGKDALGNLQKLNSGDFSAFTQSPDYQFALDEGFKAMDRSAAARGRLYSGGYGQDLTKYGQGLATQNYGNYYNRLAAMAGVGQTTASGLGQLGANYANSMGTALQNNASNRASSYMNQANAWNNGLTQVSGIAGNYFGSKVQPTAYPSNAMGSVMGTGWGWSPGWGG